MMKVVSNTPRLPQGRVDAENFARAVQRTFPHTDEPGIAYLWELTQKATKQTNGTILVISEGASQEARVHGVMRSTETAAGGASAGGRAVAQHVFELIPTVPLYLPEKIASPTQRTTFLHGGMSGGSPPHSPQLAPSYQ